MKKIISIILLLTGILLLSFGSFKLFSGKTIKCETKGDLLGIEYEMIYKFRFDFNEQLKKIDYEYIVIMPEEILEEKDDEYFDELVESACKDDEYGSCKAKRKGNKIITTNVFPAEKLKEEFDEKNSEFESIFSYDGFKEKMKGNKSANCEF